MIPYLIMLLSLMIENSYSLIFHNTSDLFLSCFCLITIFSIYELFKENDKKYLISCFVYGLIYDIVFTDTLFLNALLFLLFAYFISKVYKVFQMTFFNRIIIVLALIIVYRLGNYLIIISAFHKDFDFVLLLKSFYSSIIVSIIYMLLMHLSTFKLIKKYKKY